MRHEILVDDPRLRRLEVHEFFGVSNPIEPSVVRFRCKTLVDFHGISGKKSDSAMFWFSSNVYLGKGKSGLW